MASINDLPDELLLSILDYLSYKQRKDARFINKRWYRLCNSSKYVKNEVLVLSLSATVGELGTNRKYFNVRLQGVSHSQTQAGSNDFWSQCGEHVKSIELFRLEKLTPDILGIFTKCPNLEHISLTFSSRPTSLSENVTYPPFSFPNLLSFTLVNGEGLEDTHFRNFLKTAFKLERLNVNTSDFGYWNENSNQELIDVVSRQAKLLQELRLRIMFFQRPPKMVIGILNKIGYLFSGLTVNLRDRKFEWNPEDAVGQQRSEQVVMGKQISISIYPYFLCPSKLTREMIVSMKNLTYVSLSDLSVDDATLNKLFLLENLDTLCISRNRQIINLVQAFGGIPRPKLVDLQLNHVSIVTDDVLSNICPLMPNLRHLNLCHCPNIRERGLEAICANNKELRSLFLSQCDKISNFASVNKLVHIVHLYMDFEGDRPAQLVRNLILPELQILNFGRARLCHVDASPLLLGCPSLINAYYESRTKVGCSHIERFIRQDGVPLFRVTHNKSRGIFDFDMNGR